VHVDVFVDGGLEIGNADLGAGVVQELLTYYKTGDDQLQSDEKATVMRWIANRSEFLTKTTIRIVPLPNGEAGVGTVDFSRGTPMTEPNGRP
jgi:hypothetical protein